MCSLPLGVRGRTLLREAFHEDAEHHAAAQVGNVLLGEIWMGAVREVVGAEGREDAAVVVISLPRRIVVVGRGDL